MKILLFINLFASYFNIFILIIYVNYLFILLSEASDNIYNNNKLKWDFNKNKTDKKYLKKIIKIKIK